MIVLKEIKDIPTLMRWREEVIEHVFGEKADETLLVANRRFYEKHIADKTHYALLAEYDGEECGCGAVCFTEELPSPDNPSGRCAYLMNIYVREPFRNHGLAHNIVTRLIQEARRRECGKIYLETTETGRPVYQSLGFRDLPDLMKLPTDSMKQDSNKI